MQNSGNSLLRKLFLLRNIPETISVSICRKTTISKHLLEKAEALARIEDYLARVRKGEDAESAFVGVFDM